MSEVKEGGHTNAITALGFMKIETKDTLYSVSWDGTLRVFALPRLLFPD